MAPRSRNLWHGVGAGTPGDVTLCYTAPAGYFVIVKSIRIVNVDTDAHPVFVALDTGAVLELLFAGAPIDGLATWIDTSWHVLPDGASVVAWTDADDALELHGSGAVLGGPVDP